MNVLTATCGSECGNYSTLGDKDDCVAYFLREWALVGKVFMTCRWSCIMPVAALFVKSWWTRQLRVQACEETTPIRCNLDQILECALTVEKHVVNRIILSTYMTRCIKTSKTSLWWSYLNISVPEDPCKSWNLVVLLLRIWTLRSRPNQTGPDQCVRALITDFISENQQLSHGQAWQLPPFFCVEHDCLCCILW